MNDRFSIENLQPLESFGILEIRADGNPFFDKAASLAKALENSIVWVKKSRDSEKVVVETAASFIVVRHQQGQELPIVANKAILLSDDPKLTFSRICRKFFQSKPPSFIHPSAIISKDARICSTSTIGPNCVIGNAIIGSNCELRASVVIGDQVTLGDFVVIDHGAVLGSEGYGYSRSKSNEIEAFPQMGGVVVGDNVYIGANTTVDRGTLDDTIIGHGSKIDNLVHIAHNVVIGKNVLVIANSMVAGSVRIGDNAWIAPSASILNQLKVEEGAIVGLGGVVLKNIPANQTWVGNPARPLKEFLKFNNKA